MTPLTKLLIDVQNGDVNPDDLTAEQQEMVLAGYRELASRLLEDPEFTGAAEQMLDVIDAVDVQDPFRASIDAAEQRGSTYFELEHDSLQ